tara:strand:- start:551 stop:2230 length:1680 start_codon:yes stop_codon:yes gene_type:complete
MKVPTYKSQVKLNQAGSGNFLTVQADPNVYAQSGKALADLGKNILNMTVKKFEIEAQTQVNNASSTLDSELYAISEKWKEYPHPQAAETSFLNEVDRTITKFNSGKKNDTNGIPLLSNNLARNSFVSKAQELKIKYLREFKKHNNDKLISLNKGNLSLEIDHNASIVANISQTSKDRISAFKSIFSSDVIENADGTKSWEGSLSRAFADGTIDAEELVTRKKAALSSIVKGTMQNLMNASENALSIAQGFSKETLKDPIMKAMFALLSEDQKFELTKSFTTMANSIEKQRQDAKDAENKRIDKERDKNFNEIFNLDPRIPNQNTKIQAIVARLINKKQMTKQMWKDHDQYMKRFEEPEEKDKDKKSDRTVISTLIQLDATNNLTLDAVNAIPESQITLEDFKKYAALALKEMDDANKQAKVKISSAFKYEQYKDDNSNLSDLAKEMYFATYISLTEWREKDGKMATYSEVQEKAKELIKANKEPLKELVRDQFNTFLKVMKGDGFFGKFDFELDESNPIKSVSDFFTERTSGDFKADAFLYQRYIEFKPYITYFAEDMK